MVVFESTQEKMKEQGEMDDDQSQMESKENLNDSLLPKKKV
jgi:hypothetical protein